MSRNVLKEKLRRDSDFTNCEHVDSEINDSIVDNSGSDNKTSNPFVL